MRYQIATRGALPPQKTRTRSPRLILRVPPIQPFSRAAWQEKTYTMNHRRDLPIRGAGIRLSEGPGFPRSNPFNVASLTRSPICQCCRLLAQPLPITSALHTELAKAVTDQTPRPFYNRNAKSLPEIAFKAHQIIALRP